MQVITEQGDLDYLRPLAVLLYVNRLKRHRRLYFASCRLTYLAVYAVEIKSVVGSSREYKNVALSEGIGAGACYLKLALIGVQ